MSTNDPVSAKSGFLCMYMSSHPDTLTAYIKHQGKVPGLVSSPKLESISTKSMILSYIAGPQGSYGSRKEVVVDFKPPLSGYDEVKGRMLGMKADAQEALGMIKTPKLNNHLPPFFKTVFPGVLLWLGLAYLAYPTSPRIQAEVARLLAFAPLVRDTVLPNISKSLNGFGVDPFYVANRVPGHIVTIVSQSLFVIHVLESLFTYSIVRKNVEGFWRGSAFVLATLVSGFPVWGDLLRRIKQARIDSVMKIE